MVRIQYLSEAKTFQKVSFLVVFSSVCWKPCDVCLDYITRWWYSLLTMMMECLLLQYFIVMFALLSPFRCNEHFVVDLTTQCYYEGRLYNQYIHVYVYMYMLPIGFSVSSVK